MSAHVVVSLGYERRSLDDLVELLHAHGVGKLLDIRELPLSRRPGFSKRALAAGLEEAGIEYCHLRQAGNPHRKLKADIAHCLSLYRAHLCDNPDVVKTVASELSDGPVAMLCYEREHDCCHRSVLLDALAQHGHPVEVVRLE